ncbi:MAG: hypothetical protein ACR2O4_12710, partial [Hyphomicrobiaceae bacterium]
FTVDSRDGSADMNRRSDTMELIIQLIAGALGGNAAGAAMKDKSLGPIGNSLSGIVGGGLVGQLLGPMLGMGGGGMDIGSIISSLISGGAGGGVMMIIVGLIKNMMSNR